MTKKVDEFFLDGDNIARWNTEALSRKFYLENVISLCIYFIKNGIPFYCIFDPGIKSSIIKHYGEEYLEIFKFTTFFSYPTHPNKADDQLILFLKDRIENYDSKAFIITNDLYRNEKEYLKEYLNPKDSEKYRLLPGTVRFNKDKPISLVVNKVGISVPVKEIEDSFKELMSLLSEKENAEIQAESNLILEENFENYKALALSNSYTFKKIVGKHSNQQVILYNKDRFTSISKNLK